MRIPGLQRGSDAISPTAHYTGQVWVRNGLSHPELGTREGRLFFESLQPLMAASRISGGPTLEGSLLARHELIDRLLEQAIEAGVGQVIEVACGMSGRGWRFSQRYGDRIDYVEADLPQMARRKRAALGRIGSLGEHHRVVELDVLEGEGPRSIAGIASGLDPERGTAILSEGLLTYFPEPEVLAIWRRFAAALRPFPQGRYLADIRLIASDLGWSERGFGLFLSAFVRGRVHAHFAGEAEAEAALRESGFDEARLHPGTETGRSDPGARRIHVLEAAVAGPAGR